IIMAEERANAIAIATITAGQPENSQENISGAVPKLDFDYSQIMAPSITGLLVVVAFFYCKGAIDLRNATSQVRKTL
ncbi:MAG TPA: hypothetical protein VFW99_01205, partial [Candidatus Nitrosotalea sp.]|nr:hypothetical protein [Candidatus Nitrosotalea sp.]